MCVVIATTPNRPLTAEERRLAHWMLENGNAQAHHFVDQLERAEVSPVRCPCGCASIDFRIQGMPEPQPGIRVLADFVFGDGYELSGIFIFECNGILSGIEVYGFANDAPKVLPAPEMLRPANFPPPRRD